MTVRFFLFCLAVIVALTLLWISLQTHYVFPERERLLLEESTIQRVIGQNTENSGHGASIPGYNEEHVVIEYSSRMKYGESGKITLYYYPPKLYEPTSETEHSASLFGTAFKIAPTVKVTKIVKASPLDDNAQQDLEPQGNTLDLNEPLIFRWSISPTSTGDHNLLLDLDDLFLFGGESSTFSIYDKHEESNAIPISSSKQVDLPFYVYNVWGVPEKVGIVMQWVCAVLAYVFSFPYLLEINQWLKNKRKKEEELSDSCERKLQ